MNNLYQALRNFFQPSISSITADFRKTAEKLEALAEKRHAEVVAHADAITDHQVASYSKACERDEALRVASNINKLLNTDNEE